VSDFETDQSKAMAWIVIFRFSTFFVFSLFPSTFIQMFPTRESGIEPKHPKSQMKEKEKRGLVPIYLRTGAGNTGTMEL
jgi:hypothetical protein